MHGIPVRAACAAAGDPGELLLADEALRVVVVVFCAAERTKESHRDFETAILCRAIDQKCEADHVQRLSRAMITIASGIVC